MRRLTQIVFVAALILTASSATAREFEITPFFGYQWGGDVETFYQGRYENVDINDGENWGIMLNIGLNDAMQIELLYNTQDTGADARRFDDTLDLNIDYWQVSMLWSFNPYETVNPYIVFGIGGTWMRPEGFSSLSRFSGNVGGGAKFYFSDRIGLRLEGRIYGTYINSTTSYCDPFWCYGYNNSLYQFDVSAGLIIRFGD